MIIMLEEGVLPEQVDKMMVDFGYPIGPFATAWCSTSGITAASGAFGT
jgi:3-hydroxyacyl-CoA dehydrogenase